MFWFHGGLCAELFLGRACNFLESPLVACHSDDKTQGSYCAGPKTCLILLPLDMDDATARRRFAWLGIKTESRYLFPPAVFERS